MSEGGKKKKIYIVVAAAAVVFIALAVALVLRGGAETYRSIRIVELEGGVTIDRDNVGSLEASVNMNLVSGDHVSTSAGAYVVLRLDEDKYVMLGEQGSMQVEADGDASNGRTFIHLEEGSVLNEIQKPLGQNGTYEIVTPSATMSVRGTVFEVRSNGTGSDGDIEVLVYEGKVAVELADQEPVLYVGGEYTQFTAGDTPEFLVERSAITKEHINRQMLQRLQQIEDSGRSLNFGETKLEELIGQGDSAHGALMADNGLSQSTAAPDSTAAAGTTEFGEQNAVTTAPSPAVTSSAEPVSTGFPQPSEIPTPKATAKPKPSAPLPSMVPPTVTVSPAVPTPSAVQTPTPTTAPSATQSPSETPSGNVVFFLPPIAGSDTVNGYRVAKIINTKMDTYKQLQVAVGNVVEKPEDPVLSGYTLEGWYTEAGERWNFADKLSTSSLKLYPVWKDAGGVLYYPVFLRAPEINLDSCYCMKAGSYLYQRPGIINDEYKGYEWPAGADASSADYNLLAWEKLNQNNALWGIATEKVDGVENLKAIVVRKDDTSHCRVLYTTKSKAEGYGDIVQILPNMGKNSTLDKEVPKRRALSDGIDLSQEKFDQIKDWQREEDGQSISCTDPLPNKEGTYIFHAVW